MRRRDDEGTVLLLTIGMSVVLLLLVAVVVDVSKVILAKRALSSAADGAALAAAQRLDRDATLANGPGERIPLDPADVAAVVEQYQDDADAEQPGLDLTGTVDAGDVSVAVVDARRKVSLPFVGWLGVVDVDLHAQARAQSPVLP